MRDHDGRGSGPDENRDEARDFADVFENDIVLARAESPGFEGRPPIEDVLVRTANHVDAIDRFFSRRTGIARAQQIHVMSPSDPVLGGLLHQFLQAARARIFHVAVVDD